MRYGKYILWSIAFSTLVAAAVAWGLGLRGSEPEAAEPQPGRWWAVQSVDTMKHSRDLAREMAEREDFEEIIAFQIQTIAQMGATHVAIATPYDAEFLPFLEKWVSAARENNLNVWFRGNFSGWEGWFDYEPIAPSEHVAMTRSFILNNSTMFEDGDIFTACPECENGNIGDPRMTGEVEEYKEFLVELYEASSDAFSEINKQVDTRYFSMNGDVASLIMDKETSGRLGSLVTIDHYVLSPHVLNNDIARIAEYSGSRVAVGEMGAPIFDIHGEMTPQEQAEWLEEAFSMLAQNKNVEAINYWVLSGGSTRLVDDDGSRRPAHEVISSFFKPRPVQKRVLSESGNPIGGAVVTVASREFTTNYNGLVDILVPPKVETATVRAPGYIDFVFNVEEQDTISLTKTGERRAWIFIAIDSLFRKTLMPFIAFFRM